MILALTGGAEFRPGCIPADRRLLALAAPGRQARVAILPTAARFSQPHLAAENGVRHFAALGASARPLLLLDRADAARPEILEQIEATDLLYVAGGDPVYLLDTLRDSPAWGAILDRWRGGTLALAGSSAGAMILGRRMWRPRQGDLTPALDLLPVVVLPHHEPGRDDRLARLRPTLTRDESLLALPEMATVLWDGAAWEVLIAPVALQAAEGDLRQVSPGDPLGLPGPGGGSTSV